jgi:hypothetical protein
VVVVHACNPSTQEVEAGGSGVQSQPGPHSKTLSQVGGGGERKKRIISKNFNVLDEDNCLGKK